MHKKTFFSARTARKLNILLGMCFSFFCSKFFSFLVFLIVWAGHHAVAPSGGDAFNGTGQSLLSHMMAFMEHHHHHQHHVIHFMEQDSHNHQCIIHSSGPLFPG